ncbi:uncharacterized protein [Paramisgurnus dabryanus]|uniref:uncharacterized protein n=1 Tax=Paramisgurnus dabryanus TaxID=90735 RepID=UPI0031F3B23A
MFGLFSLIRLLVIPAICGQKWTVNYFNRVNCALKGSTTFLSGNFTYPDGLTITKIFWTTDPIKCDEKAPDLSKVPEYKDRVKYIMGEKQNFLKLSNVTDQDGHRYCMKILTNLKKEKYLGRPGIKLKVTELRVEVPEEVVEGNSAVLFCKSTCLLASNTNFTWYKNKSPLSESFSSNKLKLQSVSRDDEGNYSCAVRGDEDLKSPDVTLMILTESPCVGKVTLGVTLAVIITSVSMMLLVVLVHVWIFMRRKRATSEVQNNTNLQHHKTMESSEMPYMTLDPKTTNADYDTLDNVRKSTDNRQP